MLDFFLKRGLFLILSASRRTDIPSFYGTWFMKRLEEGYFEYRNPFNQKVYPVSVNPNFVQAIVFWSKDFQPFTKYLPIIEKNYSFIFHYTITGLSQAFELSTPSVDKAIENFQFLAERYPNRVLWRFDPIILSSDTSPEQIEEKFDLISSKLKGYTSSCFFSFVQSYYAKVKRNLERLAVEQGVYLLQSSFEEEIDLLIKLKALADQRGLTLFSCCQDRYSLFGIEEGSCIDKRLLIKLFPEKDFSEIKKAGTRKECHCYKSIDIGAYDSCPHGCAYCYANVNQVKAIRTYDNHNSDNLMI